MSQGCSSWKRSPPPWLCILQLLPPLASRCDHILDAVDDAGSFLRLASLIAVINVEAVSIAVGHRNGSPRLCVHPSALGNPPAALIQPSPP